MTNKRINFAQFEKVMKELGFQKRLAPERAVVFKHSTLDSIVIVRMYKPKEIIPDFVMIGTKVQLDRQGVVEEAEFEKMFQAVAA